MDISNKSVALLLVVAIVVSLGGTIISLNKLNQVGFSGFAASDTGIANFSITQNIVITFNVSSVDFGSGVVNNTGSGTQNCTLSSEGVKSTNCVNFTTVSQGLVIQNDGNNDVNLTLQVTQNASDFFPAGDPAVRAFEFKLSNNEASSCNTALQYTSYTAANTIKASAQNVCQSFNYEDSQDTLLLDIRVVIPEDAQPGARLATFTATGS